MKMSKNTNQKLVLAAVAAISLAAAAPAPVLGQDSPTDVKCYGVNSCKGHSGCGVKSDDVAAVKMLLGDDFETQFGKTKTHSCAAHGSCGAKQHVLNWTKVSADDCKTQGGIVIEEQDGMKVAKKL